MPPAAVGRRSRCPAIWPGARRANKGLRYPPDPPTVEEIVAVMRQAGDGVHGARLRALIVLLWRAGLRINEALTLTEHDLDARGGAVLVRYGKGGRRREVGMDPWGWDHLRPWLAFRMAMPVGPLLCVVDGPTPGRPWASDAARAQLRRVAAKAGVRRRFAPHQLRHAHAASSRTSTSRSTSSSANWATRTSASGIDNAEIIATVHARKAPMIPASTGLRI
jgi:integrase